MSSSTDSMLLNCKIPEEVQDNLVKVIHKFRENGLWGSDLEMEYKKVAKKELKYMKYGYGSVLHMCTSVDYIFVIVKHFKGDFKLFHPKSYIPPNLNNLTNNDLTLIPSVIECKDVIPRQQLAAINNRISIKISDVFDPSKFWFYTLEMEKKLIDVMGRMQLFYASTGKYYHIPTYKMKNRLYCAALYLGRFHRAVIINVLPELVHSVKVFFIDYGTLDTVQVKNVYFLHESFREPNAVAMRGQLALVKPKGLNMPWSDESIFAFIDTASNRCLQAHIESRLEKETVFVVKLYDNAHDKKKWIHEHLVQKGVAIMNTDEQDAALSIPEFANNKQMMHLVPSFAHLESGAAITKDEFGLLCTMNYPLAKILKKYLKYDS